MSFERIRKIENELETGQLQTRERSIIHDVKTPKVSDSWNTDSKLVTPTKEDSTIASSNWFRRLFILSIIFATIGGLVFVSAVFFSPQNVSDKNVIVSVNARSSVDGGESFSSTVIVTNKNKVPLEFVKIALQYPLVPGGDVSGLSQEVAIDSIAPGEIKEVPFTVSLYGSANTSRTLTAKVVYRVPGSVALFESISTTETLLRSSPMRLTIDAPSEVFPNQETTLTVTYASNLKNLSPSSMLRMSYPPGFRFMSADPKPDVDNHTWKVGTLLPGATNTISITGVLGGVLREEKIFSATLGSISATQTDFESIYATSVTPSVITPTFLALSLGTESLIASGNRYVISSHEQDFSINFKNTQNTSITRAKIRITFSGNIFNEQFLRPGTGFYESSTNTLSWTSDELPVLYNIPPGGEGTIEFGFKNISSILSDGTLITNPLLSMSVSIEGISENGKQFSASGALKQDFTLASEPSLATVLLTSRGPIKNSGAYPAIAGKETTYTIGWKLSNTISEVGSSQVSAVLPQWVRYTGIVSPQSASGFIKYNEVTRTITWSPGTLAAGTGYGKSSPLEVYFQIAFKPSLSQVGSAPLLIGPAVFTGRDQVVGIPLQLQGEQLNTGSAGDKGIVIK